MTTRTRWILAILIGGAILLGSEIFGSIQRQRLAGEELARRATAEDARTQKMLEDGRRMIDKPMAQIVQEARERDAAKALAEAKEKARETEAAELALVEQQCRFLFRREMSYLAPDGSGVGGRVGKGREYRLRYVVRLSDSFRAAPVGVVECWFDLDREFGLLVKVPM